MKLRQIFYSILISTIFLISSSNNVFAVGSASLGLSGGGSYEIGSTLNITVTENSGSEVINAVQADVSYDPSKLQYLGFNGILPCPIIIPSSGFVSVGCNITGGGGVAGYQSVGVASFKALADTGSTALSLSQTAMIIRQVDASDIWDHSAVDVTISFFAPAPPLPISPQSSQPTNSTTVANTTPKQTSQDQTVVSDNTAASNEEVTNTSTMVENNKAESIVPGIEGTSKNDGWLMLLLTIGISGMICFTRWLSAKK